MVDINASIATKDCFNYYKEQNNNTEEAINLIGIAPDVYHIDENGIPVVNVGLMDDETKNHLWDLKMKIKSIRRGV